MPAETVAPPGGGLRKEQVDGWMDANMSYPIEVVMYLWRPSKHGKVSSSMEELAQFCCSLPCLPSQLCKTRTRLTRGVPSKGGKAYLDGWMAITGGEEEEEEGPPSTNAN